MIKVIDDFLTEDEFFPVWETLMGPYMVWHYNNYVTDKGNPNNGFQFISYFFRHNDGFIGRHTNLIQPYCDKLGARQLIRIKANLRVRDTKRTREDYHVDFNLPCKSAIAYINTNNGYTEFETGEKVNSVANRVVIFDSHMRHAGVTCTDQNTRVVLNFNYFDYL